MSNPRNPRFALAGALALGLAALCAPAEARIADPGAGGALSGGFFHGLPVRAEKPARPAEPEVTGVAGDHRCTTLRQTVQDRLGGTQLRTVRVCE